MSRGHRLRTPVQWVLSPSCRPDRRRMEPDLVGQFPISNHLISGLFTARSVPPGRSIKHFWSEFQIPERFELVGIEGPLARNAYSSHGVCHLLGLEAPVVEENAPAMTVRGILTSYPSVNRSGSRLGRHLCLAISWLSPSCVIGRYRTFSRASEPRKGMISNDDGR